MNRHDPTSPGGSRRELAIQRDAPIKMSLKISLVVLAAFLLCAGWRAYMSAPIHADASHRETALPSQFSTLSPESNATVEAKIKGRQRTLANYLAGSADFRRRLDEISGKYSLSPEDHKPSDDPNLRTGERLERRDNGRW
jgi:hypothetical protein